MFRNIDPSSSVGPSPKTDCDRHLDRMPRRRQLTGEVSRAHRVVEGVREGTRVRLSTNGHDDDQQHRRHVSRTASRTMTGLKGRRKHPARDTTTALRHGRPEFPGRAVLVLPASARAHVGRPSHERATTIRQSTAQRHCCDLSRRREGPSPSWDRVAFSAGVDR